MKLVIKENLVNRNLYDNCFDYEVLNGEIICNKKETKLKKEEEVF